MNAVRLVGMLMDISERLVRFGNLNSSLWATSHCIFVMYFAVGQCQDRTLVCGLSYGFMQRGGKNTELHVIEMHLSEMFLNVFSNGVKFTVCVEQKSNSCK